MKHLFFVLNYTDGNNNSVARYMELSENSNLMTLYKDFGDVYDDEIGEKAYLNIIHQCSTKKAALAIIEAWNNTYKRDERLFGGCRL